MSKPIKISAKSIKAFAVRYKHFVWTALVPLFIASFVAVETLITTDYWVSYSRLDDFIPFVPEFVVFYFLWYPLLFFVGLYLVLRDAAGYRRYMWAMMTGFFVTLLFYLIMPNGQDLRPASFASQTIYTRTIGALYALDTNTNVLPSMHVIGTVIATVAVFDARGLRRLRIPIIVLAVLINLSTVLIKQHSVLDIFAGLAFCIPLYIVYYVFVKKRQDKTAAEKCRRLQSFPEPD